PVAGATPAAPAGAWRCPPATGRAATASTRLPAVAALNGVSAMSEQIDIVVTAEAGAGRQ
ncbi:hypothetical protein ACFZBC_24095, partial [Streptomyces luteogriseus]